MKVVTVTANPLLDKFVHIDELRRGKSHRGQSVKVLAGGKGINVSRQLTRFGVDNIATGFCGGATGERIESIAVADGIKCDFVQIEAETREGFSIIEQDGTMTIVFEPAAYVNQDEVRELHAKLENILEEGDWLLFAGSVPCVELESLYADLIFRAQTRGVKTFLDSHGKSLELGLHAKPTFLKVNDEELGAFLKCDLTNDDACVRAVRDVASQYASYVVLTRGEKSFFAAHQDRVWCVTPPHVETISPLGSGDSMSAGILYGLAQDDCFEKALQWGAATGAVNASKISVADNSLDEVSPLVAQVCLSRI